jgi:flagellar motor switch/type III secretory pathway protein FliN
MIDLTTDLAGKLVEACKAGAEQAASAFGRVLDTQLSLAVGEPGEFDASALADGGGTAALVAVLKVGSKGVFVVLPESSGLVPPWCAAPDATGRGTLDTLAQELAVLLPEDSVTEASTAWVEDLAQCFARASLAPTPSMIPLELRRADGTVAVASLVWPVKRPDNLLYADRESGETRGPDNQHLSSRQSAATVALAENSTPHPAKPSSSLDDLPHYARSLLRIKVPVIVTLARKRQPLGQILDLGPGSIIQFEKSCEEMLDLDVGGHPVATGEAVKVGDKFGLRLSSIVLPSERFRKVTGRPHDSKSAG